MKTELLISAVNAEPLNLLKKMQVSSDAVLINQCGGEGYSEIPVSNGSVRVFDSSEKGVGRSRNKAIEESRGDILLFSDDDIVYVDGYENLITGEFEKHPEADLLFFNVEVCAKRRTYWNDKYEKAHIYNSGRFPAYSIGVRKKALDKAQVRFSLLFGGGAKYSCGEDSLFIRDCLKAGIKAYKTTVCLGREEPRSDYTSTWFNGYNEKFFFDRGVLYAYLYGPLAGLWGFRFVFLKKSLMCREIPWKKAYKILKSGIKEGKRSKRS